MDQVEHSERGWRLDCHPGDADQGHDVWREIELQNSVEPGKKFVLDKEGYFGNVVGKAVANDTDFQKHYPAVNMQKCGPEANLTGNNQACRMSVGKRRLE